MREISATLNDKGLLLIGGIILILALSVGYMFGISEGEKSSYFTYEDITQIDKAKGLYGDNITVKKDRKGNLIISLGAGSIGSGS